jgi:hypothetical protein
VRQEDSEEVPLSRLEWQTCWRYKKPYCCEPLTVRDQGANNRWQCCVYCYQTKETVFTFESWAHESRPRRLDASSGDWSLLAAVLPMHLAGCYCHTSNCVLWICQWLIASKSRHKTYPEMKLRNVKACMRAFSHAALEERSCSKIRMWTRVRCFARNIGMICHAARGILCISPI